MLQRRMTGGECMKTAAVIAEYNPFHNGHRYQLECARKKCGADYVVVLLCGDYTQRGEPAMIDKYSRTRAALVSGADLVIGMQVSTAVSGAERYAGGAVSELNALGAGRLSLLRF
jgi:cytidyltransferase-like protein